MTAIMLSADEITKDEFAEILKRYPALIKNISDSKSTKSDKESLAQLDSFRFEEAPDRYGKEPGKAAIPLSHDDLVKLVTWKLKHGKFRPNLMNLASSNSSESIKEITESAFSAFDEDTSAVSTAIKALTALRGIGPATASLLLSVHAPASVVFFSDELFRWICCGDTHASIKYNFKEYEDLVTKSRKVIKRLDVDARDVEKVGFVLMREPQKELTNGNADRKESNKAATKARQVEEEPASSSSKRKVEAVGEDSGDTKTQRPTRSKRIKK